MNAEATIDVQNEQDKLPFTSQWEALIEAVIAHTFAYEQVSPRGVSVVIVDDDAIQRLNKEYRGKDAPTDVLSFPLYDQGGKLDDESMGDIVISLERAAVQAAEYGHSLQRELAFLTAHSMLHLMGYDHENGQPEMFEKQREILDQLGIVRD